jgi:excisionase family DNA binding protein
MGNPKIDNETKEKVSSGNTDPQRSILTVQEVANLLRVHRATISRYAMSGELRSYLIGNRRLFRESDVWVFFENRIAPESQVGQRCVFGKEEHNGYSHDPKARS